MRLTSQIVLASFCEFSSLSLSHTDRAQDEKHSEEVSHFQEELADAHAQLQILQKQLDDELNKQPLTNQEVQCGFVVNLVSYLVVLSFSQSLLQYMPVMP